MYRTYARLNNLSDPKNYINIVSYLIPSSVFNIVFITLNKTERTKANKKYRA